jgi:histidyl-tRNA synthetase
LVKTARDYSPALWRRLAIIRTRLERFLDRRGYDIATTPILDRTDLFLRKSGGELAARMYSFTDPSGRQVSLRPEFTSSVVRSYIEGGLKGPLPQRWQYCGTIFRYESGLDGVGPSGDPSRDEAGGMEYQQLGAEVLGAGSVSADAEVLAIAVQGLRALGVKGHRLRLGHMGVVNAMLDGLGLSERARVFILSSFADLRDGAEGMGRVRARATELGLLGQHNPNSLANLVGSMEPKAAASMVEGFLAEGVVGMTGQRTPEEIYRRYLKKLREAGVPEIIEKSISFTAELVAINGPADRILMKLRSLVRRYKLDAKVLDPIVDLLKALSIYDLSGIPVELDLGMARGPAYYTGVVFDMDHPRVKGQPGLGGGGRYDGLVRALGGKRDIPALGFAYAVDRIAELLPRNFGDDEADGAVRVLVTAQGAGGMTDAVETAERLRSQGIPAELDLSGRNDAEAAKYAQQRGIQTVMRVGSDGRVAEQSI